MSLQTRLGALISAIGADIKTLNTGLSTHTHNYLAASGKAVDSELLDGRDSTDFLLKGSASGVSGLNTTSIATPNQRLRAGAYEISSSAYMPDTGWWHLQVYAHTNETNSYFRQVAYAFGDNRIYHRKIAAGAATDVTIPGMWTAWEQIDAGATIDGGTP